MSLRRRTATCDYCRVSWNDAKKNTYTGLKFKSIKALSLDHSSFAVYADSVMVWKGSACCAWSAREKAVEELGTSKFIKGAK